MTAATPASFASHLRAGHQAVAGWMGMPSPLLAELFAREAFDTVIIDMQHGTQTFDAALQAIAQVHLVGKAAGVRLQLDDFSNGARYLDCGAEYLIAPMINSAEDARRFVQAVKYPPVGERSWGPSRTLMLNGQDPVGYMRGANQATLALAMIETRAALDAVDAILAVPGIDGVFLGPSDMSIALSQGATVDPHGEAVAAAAVHIQAAARRAGKITGCYGASIAHARAMMGKGWQLVALTNDTLIIREGVRHALAQLHAKA